MKKYSLGALVAAGLLVGGLTAGSASAADLGGNCCADLEERIAELEATTARKGNRKVSLSISGWVSEQVMWWDDGFEQNVYIGDIGHTLSTHVKFTGQATISPGWYAGYVLQLEANTTGSLLGTDQKSDDGSILPGTLVGMNILQSFWFVKSDNLGKVSVGRQSQASDNTAILVDGSGSLVPANWVLFDAGGFYLRNSANGNPIQNAGNASSLGAAKGGFLGVANALTWYDITNCRHGGAAGDCNGATNDVVRYDSPTFAGFSVSASWGEDDMWDVAARYAGEMGGFKIAAAGAYDEVTDEGLFAATIAGGATKVKYFQAGLYIEHVATGLFGYGAYGHLETEGFTLGIAKPILDGENWYVKGGLRERWTPLGHTVVYGEYMQANDMGSDAIQGSSNVYGTEFRQYGAGVVQEIDAAAMSVWLSYKHYEGDFEYTGVGPLPPSIEDFDLIKAGALINF